jgi:exonuclease III
MYPYSVVPVVCCGPLCAWPLVILLFHLLPCSMDNPNCQFKFLSWNVRGLNSGARQEDLKQVVASSRPDIVCIQETKMALVTPQVVTSSLGQSFQNNFFFLPTEGTRGGTLLAAHDDRYYLQNPALTAHTISATVSDSVTNVSWTITGVYRPQGDLEKKNLH